MKKLIQLAALLLTLSACNSNEDEFDASGSFEADEVIVSAQANGQLLNLSFEEGDSLYKGQVAGFIDATQLELQKQQVEASISALDEKTATAEPTVKLLQQQISVQRSQLQKLLHERERIRRLVAADAATGKQLDDINAEIEVLQKQISVTGQQINVQRTNIATQNRSILSEKKPLQKQVASVDEQLNKTRIINPINGIVLSKYAEEGEFTAYGKPVYKIADVRNMTLRAYISGSQLSEIKLNQPVKVYVDKGADDYRTYDGVITAISDKAEFTPKTIQTKEERANLVYAVKIIVPNDGFLKIGMYGEVKLQNKEDESSARK